ncbi:MAG: formyltransferase family protein [Lentilitoribacter sp.]
MRIIILTGDEMRHQYFRNKLALAKGIEVLASYCEGVEKSLANQIKTNPNASDIEKLHIAARTQSETDYFQQSLNSMGEQSNARKIAKGAINDADIVKQIIDLNPDLLICYGSSLIKSELLQKFEGKFLNVHLGLSPYYRGAGTNVWPLINGEPDMVGATFMYIDEGIDTGSIIHQIRADVYLGDSPHSIGNRLITKMTESYIDLILSFDQLAEEKQPQSDGKLYLQKHFDQHACRKLYDQFADGMIEDYILKTDQNSLPYIVRNQGMSSS